MRWAIAIAPLCLACTDPQVAPCEAVDDPFIEVVPAGMDFDEWVPGDELVSAIPPQGGAPYTPLRARVGGLVDPELGVTLRVTGRDPSTDEEYGSLDNPSRLVCANVGDSAGTWLAADVHFRYFNWELSELDGRDAEITFEVEDGEGNVVSTVVSGPLTVR